MKRFYWLFLAFGCGLEPWAQNDSGRDNWSNDDRGAADADTDVDADTDADSDITYPTDDMNSILLYSGHGGPGGDGAGGWGVFHSVITPHWRDTHDWNVHWQASLPDTDGFEYYRMVGLMGPGSTDDQAFSEADRIKLRRTLDNGTRIVLFADFGSCDNPHTAALLESLGVSIRLTELGAGQRLQVPIDEITIKEGHQITQGVSSLKLEDPCYVSKGESGTALITWNRGSEQFTLAAVERPGEGGEVVVIGDFQLLDDSGNFYEEDNHVLVDNLATIVP